VGEGRERGGKRPRDGARANSGGGVGVGVGVGRVGGGSAPLAAGASRSTCAALISPEIRGLTSVLAATYKQSLARLLLCRRLEKTANSDRSSPRSRFLRRPGRAHTHGREEGGSSKGRNPRALFPRRSCGQVKSDRELDRRGAFTVRSRVPPRRNKSKYASYASFVRCFLDLRASLPPPYPSLQPRG
jgi:hypothetical protein